MPEPARQSDVTAPADRRDLLAPDTSGMNFYRADPALAWEGGRIHEIRGDARRLLLSRMVIDHRVSVGDPFRLTENPVQRAIADHLLGARAVGMAEVGDLLSAA